MQACDTIVVLGSSVNTSHIGYDTSQWTPLAKRRLVIDIDYHELHKGTVKWDLAVQGDLRGFFAAARSISNEQG
jgi:thiamine pyrophosphate-dependent acetolactate synthase large subunit-like protein